MSVRPNRGLNRTYKVRNRLLKHCHHDYDVDAAIHIWSNPEKLVFDRVSPLGEGKDMTKQEDIDNICRKRKRGVVEYMEYHFTYGNKIFKIKLDRCMNGCELFYSLVEK